LDKSVHIIQNHSKLAHIIKVILIANKEFKKKDSSKAAGIAIVLKMISCLKPTVTIDAKMKRLG
jgi:hypothetical protein